MKEKKTRPSLPLLLPFPLFSLLPPLLAAACSLPLSRRGASPLSPRFSAPSLLDPGPRRVGAERQEEHAADQVNGPLVDVRRGVSAAEHRRARADRVADDPSRGDTWHRF